MASANIYALPAALLFQCQNWLDRVSHQGGQLPLRSVPAVFANNYHCCVMDEKVKLLAETCIY